MNKLYQSIHKYDFLTEELLIEEYKKNGLTDREIAKKYEMPSKTVVWRKRKKFGIGNKKPNKSNKNAKKNRKFEITKQEADKLKKEGKTFKEIAEHMGCSIVVAKRRFKELGLSKKQKHTQHFEYYNVRLDDHQKQFLIGSTLGDGCLTESNAYYTKHSVKQVAYMAHIMRLLENIHSGSSHYLKHKIPGYDDVITISFTTGCNRYIERLRKLFYPNNGKKIFPYDSCIKHLEPEGIAYWYSDDGCWHINRHTSRLCVEGFDKEENNKMVKFFAVKYNLDTRLHKAQKEKATGKQMYNIAFTRESSDRFIKLVRPYLIPSMMYKIGE